MIKFPKSIRPMNMCRVEAKKSPKIRKYEDVRFRNKHYIIYV